MSEMLPTYWRGPKTDFALLRSVSSALHSLTSGPLPPRVDSVIEIARLGLARDYIAEIKRLSNALVHVADEVLLALKVSVKSSVRKHHAGLHSFRSMRRMEARRRKASALRLRHSQSLASLRQRPSQARVRSTIQRLGRTTKPLA